ncbi:hypothetical protein PROFUN_03254 [Planoprotostelium fungivorum]|uniref:Uncharacterized protein n=1 Tax=Planoprotostelium fungivorum TaxID=1890364 RepID=A0A2P6NWL1_9EUKA|nr:hypothetical protein PROFUN_03254 [Planoprotostelium fungivorum]
MPVRTRVAAAVVGVIQKDPISKFIRDHKNGPNPFLISLPIAKYEEYDKKIQKRNIYMAVNTLICLSLLIATLELEILDDFAREDVGQLITKSIVTLFTALQIFQIIEYYYQHVLLVLEETMHSITYRSKIKALSRQHGNKFSYDSDATILNNSHEETITMEVSNHSPHVVLSESKVESAPLLTRSRANSVRLSTWTVFRTSSFPSKMIAEIVTTLPHCLPLPYKWATLLGLFMFFRLYIIIRVMRDLSTVYRQRKHIERISDWSSFFIFKIYFNQHPIPVLLALLTACSMIMGYTIYIFERDQDHKDGITFDLFTSTCVSHPFILGLSCGQLNDGMQLAVQVIISGWATDTWDQYNPVSPPGKVAALACVLLGLFLVAILLEYMHSKMQLSDWESTIMRAIDHSKARQNEAEQAARLIQIAWRFSLAREAEDEGVTNPYTFSLLKQLKMWKNIRKARLRREIVDGTAEENEIYDLRAYMDESVNEMRASLIKDIALMLQQQRVSILRTLGVKKKKIDMSIYKASKIETESETESSSEEETDAAHSTIPGTSPNSEYSEHRDTPQNKRKSR